MKVLVLGGYGLIGTAVTEALVSGGHAVTGLGRRIPENSGGASWIAADLAQMTSPEKWMALLDGVDAVVNAAGVLQNGLRDSVSAVQRDAITALIAACEQTRVRAFVQISAPGAALDSSTAFYRTKAEADERLKTSRLRWVILRPGLVLSPHAYGGTALIRQLAAVPVVQPLVYAHARIQTVHADDVARAALFAIDNGLTGIDADLVEDAPHALKDLVLAVRAWLGFKPPRAVWPLPAFAGRFVSVFADLGGYLGWRSPLQSTALAVIANGVTGDASRWTAATGQTFRRLDETLAALPATLQERTYARAMLAFPVMLIVLAAFWIASGIIGLCRSDAALAVIDGAVPDAAAKLAVFGGGIGDILIGAAVLFRPLTRFACLAAILLSAGYLGASALWVPGLWLDPLGPMVKVVPAMALAAIVGMLAEER